jgi:hypothetical protein
MRSEKIFSKISAQVNRGSTQNNSGRVRVPSGSQTAQTILQVIDLQRAELIRNATK